MVGSTISVTPGRWDSWLESQPVQLLRNGEPLPGTEHTLTSADVGAHFTARQVGQRPDHRDEARGVVVQFDPVTAESRSLTGKEAAPPPPPAKAASGVVLKVKKKRVRLRQRVVLVVRVRAPAPGRINGALVVKRGKKNVRRVKVRAGKARKQVRIRIPARRLKPGRHRLRVRYTGNKVTRPSVSKPVRVRVVR